MVDDLLAEDLVPLAKSAKFFPHRPCYSTLWRFANRGSRGVKLETVDVAGRPYTSQAAVQRFIRATTAVRDGDTVNFSPSRQRLAAIAKAEAELEAAGI